jgi:hypothetical protein
VGSRCLSGLLAWVWHSITVPVFAASNAGICIVQNACCNLVDKSSCSDKHPVIGYILLRLIDLNYRQEYRAFHNVLNIQGVS